jgi:hypothetical protein
MVNKKKSLKILSNKNRKNTRRRKAVHKKLKKDIFNVTYLFKRIIIEYKKTTIQRISNPKN